ncbi:hypothetical protein FOA52_010051 [Chlamydomonas sp. UWO 241]|nr:hypothetical protein FOA52_010051 [Chlamydomonas sp. UWO 241]
MRRDQALRLKREEAESTTRADAFSADIVKLETTMQSKQGELNSVVAKLRQLAELGGGIEALIARHDMLTRHTSESLGRLKVLWINSRRIDKEAMVEQYQADCMSHGRLSAEASAHAAHSAELARFMAEASAHAAHSAELVRFMGSSAQLLSLDPPAVSGLAGPALLSAAGAFSSQVAGKVSAAEAELAQLKSIHRSKDASLGDDISKVTAEISRTHEGGRMKSDEADRHGRTITALEAEVGVLPGFCRYAYAS